VGEYSFGVDDVAENFTNAPLAFRVAKRRVLFGDPAVELERAVQLRFERDHNVAWRQIDVAAVVRRILRWVWSHVRHSRNAGEQNATATTPKLLRPIQRNDPAADPGARLPESPAGSRMSPHRLALRRCVRSSHPRRCRQSSLFAGLWRRLPASGFQSRS